MRKFLMVSVSVASLGLVTSLAQAADVIPEPAPVASFTGFHIGVGGGAGYNFYDAESEAGLFFADEDGLPDPESPLLLGQSLNGNDLGAWYGFGTIEAGFDYQFEDSPFVVGILANYDFNGDSSAEAETSLFTELVADGASLDARIKAELDDSWFLGGRLGFVFNDNTLVYGLGGYTWIKGKVEADHALNVDFGGGPVEIGGVHASEKDNVDGFTIGAGIEHLITESLSLKLEYRHDFLDDIEFSEATVFEDVFQGQDLVAVHEGKVDFSRDTIRAVLSWRFNPGW